MPYDYSKLNGLVVTVCKTQAKFAELMNMSERSMSLKLNGKVGWKQLDIIKACELLRIPINKIGEYFFAE